MKDNKTGATKTMLILTVGFLVIYFITKLNWAIYVSLLIGITGIFSGYLSEKINYLWMKLAWLLSLIIPNIILTILFYFFLFPISVLSKMFGKKTPLNLKNNAESFFKSVNKQFDKRSFENPW